MGVGLFGRQAPIGLDVPKWVTIHVTPEASKRVSNLTLESGRSWLHELVEGIATIGAVGVTIVMDAKSETWISGNLDAFFRRLKQSLRHSRPYFRLVVSNYAHYSARAEEVEAGPRFILANGDTALEVMERLDGDRCYGIECLSTAVFRTNQPSRMIPEITQLVESGDIENPWTLPHWKDDLWYEGLLRSTTILLALNNLCKPGKFEDNTFLFGAEYSDEVISRAFNERHLRANWRDVAATQGEPE